MPAECFLGPVRHPRAGAAVAITTRRHARHVIVRADTSHVFDDVLLLGCWASARLAGIADLLCGNGGGHL